MHRKTDAPWGADGSWHIDGHGYQHHLFSKARSHKSLHYASVFSKSLQTERAQEIRVDLLQIICNAASSHQ